MNSGNNFNFKEQIEKGKLKDFLENLKSDYFLRRIFEYINRNKSLEIIKYNKRLQKRLNLSINDYKEYSQLYSTIEIELKLINNPYSKFISIHGIEEVYYHIYLDNSNDEMESNYCYYLNLDGKEKIINIRIDHQVKSFKGLFGYCHCIKSIIFKKFSRINITDMSRLFCGCKSLIELNLSDFNTNNVTNMSYMFLKCSSLIELNLSCFNTNNVTNMSYMFSGCYELLSLICTNNLIQREY